MMCGICQVDPYLGGICDVIRYMHIQEGAAAFIKHVAILSYRSCGWTASQLRSCIRNYRTSLRACLAVFVLTMLQSCFVQSLSNEVSNRTLRSNLVYADLSLSLAHTAECATCARIHMVTLKCELLRVFNN